MFLQLAPNACYQHTTNYKFFKYIKMSDRIKISEIIELNARLREINSFDLEKIDFISERGNVLKIDKDKIDSWKFIGLNNTDFIDSGFINMVSTI
jgi:hypothetical protein